ncbi:MAG: arsenosugar biosynthesis radical SAM (seleno)protein ArsS [Candidatus Binataceae bacterium]
MAGSAQARPQSEPASAANFDQLLSQNGLGSLTRAKATTLQVNVGKLCNQACHHCHVDAGPTRTERMERTTAERVLELLAHSPAVRTLDLTGGAPELNENFWMLVESGRRLEREVMVRCNLTVMFEPGMERLGEFYRDNRVVLICSLPCYSALNVERQRGRGVFEKSIAALRGLNALGYGSGGLELSLIYNPVGPVLPPPQDVLEADYRRELGVLGIHFNRLLTITNMPIARFARQLHQWGKYADYMGLLVNHFNPSTVEGLMCRALVSVGWDGRLYDCDFNQMLEMPIGAAGGRRAFTVWDIRGLDALTGAPIATGAHCFGCTAGAGSSCGGALVDP